MLNYLIQRLAIGCLTLFLITFLIYGLIRSMPGTPLTRTMGEGDPSQEMSEERKAQLNASYGLDKHWSIAYWHWVGRLAQGDMGRSFSRKTPVSIIIQERLGATLMLSIPSLLLGYVLAIPLGLYASGRAGKMDERILSTALYMMYSFPGFVAALFLQLLFAVKLGWLPLYGMASDHHAEMNTLQKTWDLFLHAVLPITVYTYGGLAYEARFIRANMHEVLRQDFIRTARAKGLGPIRVLWHHAFRNTLIPMVTLIGLTLPSLLSGSIIVEQIFSWPGMGQQFFASISERDYPTVMGLTLMFSVLTLAAQLLADFLYAAVDPRIRLESK